MKNGLLLLALFVAFGQVAQAAEYLVKYREASPAGSRSFSAMAIKVMDENPTAQLLKVDVRDEQRVGILAALLSHPNVEYVVDNFKLYSFQAPIQSAALKDQWHLAKINAEKAWARAGNKGSRQTVVAVIDTGVDYNHAGLKPNMVAGYNFRDNNNDPMDKTGRANPGHGTHCAGIMGATGLVDGGVIGISPEMSIMPLRFLGEDGSGDLNSAIKSIDYAIAKKVQIISASWGASVSASQAKPLIDAVKRASDAGIIMIMAAGNDGKSNDKTEIYPANAVFENTITVAASDSRDAKPSWSNYGKGKVQIASPGDGIMSTLPSDKTGNLSGTSMATPLVAGLVALLKSQDQSLTGKQVLSLMQTTGAKVNIETACNCRIDAEKAMDALLNKTMFIAPAAASLAVGETINFEAVHGRAPFTFAVGSSAVGTIDGNGVFKAVAKGETTVTVTDASGAVAKSLSINVGGGSSAPPSDPGNPGNPPAGDCPLGDQQLCDIMCQISPELPFCAQP